MISRRGPGEAAKRTDQPFVSVVMPVLNEADHLGDCLHALLSGDHPADKLEVLVVDGGSTDGTTAIVQETMQRDPRVRLLSNAIGNTPAGLNIGLDAARGDVIVRMDGHALPAQDYVRACVESLGGSSASMVGGHMVGRGDTPLGEAVAVATATRAGAGDARFRRGGEGPADTVYLGAWRRETLESVGGFDESLPRNQDYELAVRLREAGGTVWLDPKIRSTTVTRGTLSDLAVQYFGYGSGRAATLLLHPTSLRWRQAVPAAFVCSLALCTLLSPIVPGARRVLAGLLVGYAGAIVLASVAAGRGQRAQVARRLPVVFVTMHCSWGLGFWIGALKGLARGRHEPRTHH